MQATLLIQCPKVGVHYSLHAQVECGACHLKGLFKGTPKECGGCHNGQIAPGKNNRHIQSNDRCDNCHSAFSWNTAALDHGDVIGGCRSCHDGITATGQVAKHIATGVNECDGCHGTLAWLPVRMNHDFVLGTCSICHNGLISTGKHAQHIQTITECDTCHSTHAWIPARLGSGHSDDIAGRCSDAGCHLLPSRHIPVSGQCDNCHRSTAWLPPIRVDHAFVLGSCAGCHNGNDAPGTPNGHILTTQDCGDCHRALAWLPVLNSGHTHSSPDFPGQHNSAVACNGCHTSVAGTTATVIWNVAYRGFCLACHERHYKADAHKKTESPETFYTAVELKDCANGDCHLTRLDTGSVQNFPPRHQVNAGSF